MDKNLKNLELFHYGVKGMKWGVTKDEPMLRRIAGQRVSARGGTKAERKEANAKLKADLKAYKKSTTRKERRSDRRTAQQEKMRYLLEESLANPKAAITTRSPSGYQYLTTGESFAKSLLNGNAVNVNATDFAGFDFDS